MNTTSKQDVIEAIRAGYRDGDPLRHDSKEDDLLYRRAKRFFGNWQNAMVAAGLTAMCQRWSKERVIAEIRAHDPHRVRKRGFWSAHPKLASAASRHFGSKHAALRAAGFRVPEPRPMQSWTKQAVIAAIRARHQQGLPLERTQREDTTLYAAAMRLHGTWFKALAAAGIPPTHRRWTKQSILAALRERHRQGLLRKTRKDDTALFAAAKNHFGSWRAAVRVSGLPVRTVRQWTKESVLRAVHDWLAQGRTLGDLLRDDIGLYYSAIHRYKDWHGVMTALGLYAKPRVRWTKDRVILELQAWHRTSNVSIRRDNPTLASAASRLFGSLRNAFEAAGIEPSRRRWSRERIIEAIQDQYVAGLPMDKPSDVLLGRAVKRYVGHWEEALLAAGVMRERQCG